MEVRSQLATAVGGSQPQPQDGGCDCDQTADPSACCSKGLVGEGCPAGRVRSIDAAAPTAVSVKWRDLGRLGSFTKLVIPSSFGAYTPRTWLKWRHRIALPKSSSSKFPTHITLRRRAREKVYCYVNLG